MSNELADFQKQLQQLFLAGHTIRAKAFYAQYPTSFLLAVQAGFEYYFDEACAGRGKYYPPIEWLYDRVRLIKQILADRETGQPLLADEKM